MSEKKSPSKPLILDSNITVFCDVDDTLVLYEFPRHHEKFDFETAVVDYKDFSKRHEGLTFTQRFAVNTAVINKIKQLKSEGHKIVVWSHGGWEWAANVVRDLEIEEYVDVICSKPDIIFDDLAPAEWLPERTLPLPTGFIQKNGRVFWPGGGPRRVEKTDDQDDTKD